MITERPEAGELETIATILPHSGHGQICHILVSDERHKICNLPSGPGRSGRFAAVDLDAPDAPRPELPDEEIRYRLVGDEPAPVPQGNRGSLGSTSTSPSSPRLQPGREVRRLMNRLPQSQAGLMGMDSPDLLA